MGIRYDLSTSNMWFFRVLLPITLHLLPSMMLMATHKTSAALETNELPSFIVKQGFLNFSFAQKSIIFYLGWKYVWFFRIKLISKICLVNYLIQLKWAKCESQNEWSHSQYIKNAITKILSQHKLVNIIFALTVTGVKD